MYRDTFVRFQKLAMASGLQRVDEETLRRLVSELEGRGLIEKKGDGLGLTREGAEVLAAAMSGDD